MFIEIKHRVVQSPDLILCVPPALPGLFTEAHGLSVPNAAHGLEV